MFSGQRGRRRWADFLTGLLLACLAASLAQWLRAIPSAQDAEWQVFSRFAKARDSSQYAGPLTIVEMDEAAYASFAVRSPVPRDRLAALLAAICQNARPRAIGLDILLDKPSPPGHELEDDVLEEALRQAHDQGVPVILACDPQPGTGEIAAYPLPRFRRWVSVGHVDVPMSDSGEIREARWREESRGQVIPAFSVLLASRAADVPPEQTNVWLDRKLHRRGRYSPYVYYMSGADFPALPMNSLTPDYPDRLRSLSGKVVLIGATATATGDFYRTPLVSPRFGAKWPGVDIQAAMVATLLSPDVRAPGRGGEWLISALVSGLFLALLYRVGTRTGLVLSAALLPLAAFVSLCLFAFGGWLINLVPCLLAMGGCALGWGGRRVWYWQRCFDTFLTRPVHRGIGGLNSLEDLEVATGPASVMFCDLIGFSRICRSLAPEQTLRLCNYYLGPLVAIMDKHGGLLDKFLGDGCLAYFGAPMPGQKTPPPAVSAAQAVQAGLEIQTLVRRLAEDAPRQNLPALRLGVGIHTGLLCTGLIGSQGRRQFTVMGDTVNDACRVESVGHQPSVLAARVTGILIS